MYIRLNAVDAPELSAVNFVNTDRWLAICHIVFYNRIARVSLCALHYFLSQFAKAGCAELCEELPQDGMEC